MKKIISILFMLLCFLMAKSQTVTLTGPTTAASGEDIIFTFQGETSAQHVSSVSIDRFNSTYPGSYMGLNPATNFNFSSGPNGAKFTTQAFFTATGYTTAVSIIIKIDYNLIGTSGTSSATVYKTISISPPPPPQLPTGPASNQNQITFSSSASSTSFSGTNWPLANWAVNNSIPANQINYYIESSSSSTFGSISRSEHIAGVTFSNLNFVPFGSPAGTPAFTQNTYIRMKVVYMGQNYYSNILFVPL